MLFFGLAKMLRLVLQYTTRRTVGVMFARVTWNIAINVENFERYVAEQDIDTEETDVELNGGVRKVEWIESEAHAAWEGNPPTVEVLYDAVNGYMSKASLQVPNSGVSVLPKSIEAFLVSSL